jgi:predicted permease
MRLAQQLLAESSLLSLAGCLGGLLIALAGLRLLLALRPDLIPRVGELTLDWRVLAFAMLLSAATAAALGLFAAWRGARGDLREALSQSQRSQSGGVSFSLRGSLVVTQLAMTVVLLIAAGLLARSFVELMTVDPGYRTHDIVVASMMFEPGRAYDTVRIADRARYFDQLADRARAIPGVTHIGITDSPPFSGGSSNGGFAILPSVSDVPAMKDLEALFRDKTRTGYADYRMASAGFFQALGIPLLSGRMFDDRDQPNAPHVALVNAALARKQWPNENAIGKVLEFANIDDDVTPMTVVGVVGDTREQDLALPPDPMVYTFYRQRRNAEDMFLVLSTPTEAATINTARRVFKDVRSDVPMRFDTIERIIGESVASQRFMLLVVGIFGAAALLLATLGVYGVISYLVTQRGRELSIRVALGASGADVVQLVLRQGVMLAVVGAGTGAVVALGATRVLKHLLYQVSPADPVAFAGVIVVLSAVASVASYLPARRAAHLAPMDVLRSG